MMPDLIRTLLNDPACYDHPVEKIELVETHISWVLLTGRYAYKIKKPVDLGFLDFSTLKLRRQDCLEELRLNRRLASDYYLEVVGVAGSPENPHLGGVGQPFEYAVKMRQFPPEATLDRMAERGELGHEQIDALASRIARFHLSECERATADSPWGEPDEISKPVEDNFRILFTQQDKADELTALQGWCVAEQARLAPLMADRKKNGFVRECHGDLHLGNLAWVEGKLLIFDCLEFSPGLRWIDVISEVAFCYMDLLHRDHPALAARFLNVWLELSGDYEGVALLRYYAVYRALVRAKVALLGGKSDEMNGFLQLAARLAASHSPIITSLFITHGLSGSGKTTISQQWLEKHGMIRLRSDVERKRLAGLDATSRSGINEGLYSREVSRNTYAHLAHLAEGLLKSGWPVIVDAAFLEREQRDLFRDLARRLGVELRILDIRADADTLRARVARRSEQGYDASDADLRVLNHQLENFRPLGDDELCQVCTESENAPGEWP